MKERLSTLFVPTATPTKIVIVVALYFTAVLNGSFWNMIIDRIAPQEGGSYSLLTQISLFIVFINIFVVSLFKFPYIFKPVLALLLLGGAGGAYFMSQYGVVIDDDMLRNTLQTNPDEAAGLISPTLIAYVVFLGVFPSFLLLRTKIVWPTFSRNLMGTCALLIVALTLALSSILVQLKATAPFIRVNGKEMRWRAVPFNLVLSSAYLVRDTGFFDGDTSFRQIAQNPILSISHDDTYTNIVVLVVGETARAANFSLNGYERPTNPQLSKLDVTSFRRVSSCGTATAISLPCLFSDLGRSEHSISKASYRENLLDVAQRAGYRVIWIDNQSGSKGVADRVEYRKIVDKSAPSKEISDLALISEFEDALSLPDKNVLLVLHQMGSHGPEYFKRSESTEKHFNPECKNKQLDECTSNEIRNAYDNTIVTTDALLAGIIRTAKESSQAKSVSLLYISDHGESLGESGLYLHGMPYMIAPKHQTEVPMIFWANAVHRERNRVDTNCIYSLRDNELSHDNYFSTVLGLLRIETRVYEQSDDVLSKCRKPRRESSSPVLSMREEK